MIEHHANCRADYPEKVAGEPARHLTEFPIGDGEHVRQCVDCGAFEIYAVSKKVDAAHGFRSKPTHGRDRKPTRGPA